MNNKAFTISLVLALGAVIMIYSYVSSLEQDYKTRYGSEVAVVVAKTDIRELEEIHENKIDIIPKPKQFIEPSFTTSKKEVVGFISSVPIKKGEQITLNKIIAPGVRTGLARQVSIGKRAVSLSVNDDTGVTRLLKPGDRIDLMAVIDIPGTQKGNLVSKLVLQDAPVLAVGEWITTQAPRKLEKDDVTGKDLVRNLNVERNFNTITIEVEPNLAAEIVLLKSTSRLEILLRNNDDAEQISIRSASLIDVLGADVNKTVRLPAGQR